MNLLAKPFQSADGRESRTRACSTHRAIGACAVACAGRHRLLRAAGVAAAAGRLPDHLGAGQPGGRQPEHHGLERRHAAGAAARHHPRRQRDDLDQLHRLGPRHACSSTSAATSTAPRARCRPPSTPRASTCRPRCAATRPTARRNPAASPGHHPGADLQDPHAGPDLRRGVQHREPAAVAGRRAWATSRSAAARCRRCASSCEPFALNRFGISTEDVRAAIQANNANRPKGAIESDDRRLQIYTPAPGAARGRLPRPGDRLAQQRGGAPGATWPAWSTASRTRARWASSTASRRSSC